MLSPASSGNPSTVDLEIAVAITPFGATRWSRLTVGGASSVMWLVPARPGAALDWSSEAWLDALEDATTPRVAPPTGSPPCGMPSASQRAPSWGSRGVTKFPHAVVVHASEAETRAHAAARGFEVTATTAAKIAEAYAKGGALVSVELATGGTVVSTPTLRISDDGDAILPLALTGSRATSVHVTAIVIAEGSVLLPGARPLDADALSWGRTGSSFGSARATAIANGAGATWIRESASRDALFDGVAVPSSESIEAFAAGYFRAANGRPRLDCEAAARSAALGAGTVGRACAAGALARVPGGALCEPRSNAVDPAVFACGSGIDDLAIALSGTEPTSTSITRFTGMVAQNAFGTDLAFIGAAAPQSLVVFASRYEPCPVVATPPGPPSPTDSTEPESSRESSHSHAGSCNGTAAIEVDGDEEHASNDEGCGSSSTSTTSRDADGCSGDTSESSDSGDDSGTWGSCDGDSSSSSSSSSSDSSGWDDSDSSSDDDDDDSCSCGSSDDSASATPKTTLRARKQRGSSPVSRYALLVVALILPLRRSLRVAKL